MKKHSAGLAAALLASFAIPHAGWAQVVLLDFGPQSTVGADVNGNRWNNVNSPTVTNLVDISNVATPWSLYYISGNSFNPPSGFWAQNGTSGLGRLAVNTAMADGAFVAAGSQSFKFTGLNTAGQYSLKLYGGRDSSSTRVTTYNVSGLTSESQNLQTSGLNLGGTSINYNNSSVSSFAIAPSASGEITITYSSTTFAYLNAMELMEVSAIPEPSSFASFAGICALALWGMRRRRG